MRRGRTPLLWLLASVMSLAACGLPVDPADTFERAQRGQLRVGVVDNPPWAVVLDHEVVGGVEVRLVTQFAESINAELVFHTGSMSDLGPALRSYALDVLVGGLTMDSPWRKEIALSPSYLTETVVVAAADDVPLISELSGRTVAYPADEPVLAEHIRDQGGSPNPVTDLLARRPSSYRELAAVPAWYAAAHRLRPTPITLTERERVLGLPPGENRMLIEVTKFLRLHGPAVRDQLIGAER